MTTTADLVEEALNMLNRGEITSEEAARRYGEEWPRMRVAIELAGQIHRAAHPLPVSARPFVPLDKTAGWQALRAQLPVTAPRPQPTPASTVRPTFGWVEWLAHFFATGRGKVAGVGTMAMALVFLLSIGVSQSIPGDWLYRAKLGWEHLSEVTSLSSDDRAQAALNYTDQRLAELEKLAFVGRPEQIQEAQGQYLRGLEASLSYADDPKFTNYGLIYDRLNDQRGRVAYLVESDYGLGPQSKIRYIRDRLNYSVYILAPKISGNPAPPPTPPGTPGPSPSSGG